MATSIHPFLKDEAVFEPDATHALAEAFDQACRALKLPPTADRDREVIAVRIIDLARAGILDPHTLRDRVLLEARSAVISGSPAPDPGL
jgi:hypothetical protein